MPGGDTSQGWRLGLSWEWWPEWGFPVSRDRAWGRVGRRCWLARGNRLRAVSAWPLRLHGAAAPTQNNCPEWGRAPLPLWGRELRASLGEASQAPLQAGVEAGGRLNSSPAASAQLCSLFLVLSSASLSTVAFPHPPGPFLKIGVFGESPLCVRSTGGGLGACGPTAKW